MKNTIEKETIDVLIPASNVEKYISKCLNSLLNQTYKNINIIINEDNSKDKTCQIIDEYAKKYTNITVYHTENTQKSIVFARNFLLSKVQSKLFTFFDADDYAEKDYIETLYNLMKNYDADMSICAVKREKDNKTLDYSKNNKKRNKILEMNKQQAIAEMLSYNLYCGTLYAKLIKSSVLNGLTFDNNIIYGEDLAFCFKVMQKCEKFVYSNKYLYHYVIRKNSCVTAKFKPSKLTCLTCFENIMEQVKDDEELFTCASAMHGLVATELLYYIWRDGYKDKELKKRLKGYIKQSIPYIKRNKRLPKLYRKFPLVWRLTALL